jgi:hypothetical protein
MAGVDKVRTQGKAIAAFLEDSGHNEISRRVSQLVKDVDSHLYRERALEELSRMTHIQWLGEYKVKYGRDRHDWWSYLEEFGIQCRQLSK